MRICGIVNGVSLERSAEACYVLRTLLETLGLPYDVAAEAPPSAAGRLVVAYGAPMVCADAAAVVEIPSADAPMDAAAAMQVYRRATREDEPPLSVTGRRVRVEADIVGAAAFWLAGGEEREGERDEFGRTLGAASPRHQAGLLRVPVVNDLMGVLRRALERAAGLAGLSLDSAPVWPDGHEFAVLLSHDVDLWRKRTRRQLAKELARSVRAPWRLGRVVRAFCCGPDPWADLGAITDLEEQRGAHSTFFVLAGRPDRQLPGVRIVNSYPADPEAVRGTLHRLAGRGWEVALHGSFDAYASAELLEGERRDVEALAGQPVLGCRQHFLRFDLPGTWRAQAQAGLQYDATFGYHDTDGYRAGFSFPFRPFAGPPEGGTTNAGEELPLLELPLAVSDGALRDRQRLDADAAWERLEGYLARTKTDGGLLGLLWHNTYFCELDAPGYRRVYERALDWIRARGGWGASARQISDWWTRRSSALRL